MIRNVHHLTALPLVQIRREEVMVGYIDGTTGGMMLQIVMAGLVGGLVAIKIVTKNLFAGLFHRRRADQPNPEPGETVVGDREIKHRS
jgi:hypothetical protein